MVALLSIQDWYFPIVIDVDDDIEVSYENSCLFLFSNIQYISTLFAYNIAKPFMKPIYTNWILTLWVSISICLSYLLIIYPGSASMDFLDLVYFPSEFRYLLALGTIVDFVMSYLFETVLVRSFEEYWDLKEHSKGYI